MSDIPSVKYSVTLKLGYPIYLLKYLSLKVPVGNVIMRVSYNPFPLIEIIILEFKFGLAEILNLQ